MEKRYQVFVSSTYTDLVEERHAIMLALMKMDCIPAGMEHFPAADEEQWSFIKRIIDYSDYYLLIIGGRYGSLDDDGLSFTEKEYDYAVSKNIKVIALIHDKPESLSFQNSEQTPELRQKLEDFRNKVKTKRLVQFWTNPAELEGKVAFGIMNARSTYPAIGWIRTDKATSEDSLIEINELRKENKELTLKINKLESEAKIQSDLDIADMDNNFEFSYSGTVTHYNRSRAKYTWKASLTWTEIFYHVSPMLTAYKTRGSVNTAIAECADRKTDNNAESLKVDEQNFFTIEIQLQSYGLIKVENLKTTNGSMALFWTLTHKGHALMLKLRTIK